MTFGYSAAIIRATGCTPADAARVEEIMRCHHGTLDQFPRAQFDHEARISYDALRLLRAEGDPFWKEPV